MVGIVIVSHSRLAAEGIRELAAQMAGPDLRIIACGGMEDGSIGTDAVRIQNAMIEADSGEESAPCRSRKRDHEYGDGHGASGI